jgi:hypothetical protein
MANTGLQLAHNCQDQPRSALPRAATVRSQITMSVVQQTVTECYKLELEHKIVPCGFKSASHFAGRLSFQRA